MAYHTDHAVRRADGWHRIRQGWRLAADLKLRRRRGSFEVHDTSKTGTLRREELTFCIDSEAASRPHLPRTMLARTGLRARGAPRARPALHRTHPGPRPEGDGKRRDEAARGSRQNGGQLVEERVSGGGRRLGPCGQTSRLLRDPS